MTRIRDEEEEEVNNNLQNITAVSTQCIETTKCCANELLQKNRQRSIQVNRDEIGDANGVNQEVDFKDEFLSSYIAVVYSAYLYSVIK